MFFSSLDDLHMWGQNWPHKVRSSLCQVPFYELPQCHFLTFWHVMTKWRFASIFLWLTRCLHWMCPQHPLIPPLEDPTTHRLPATPPLCVPPLLLPIPMCLLLDISAHACTHFPPCTHFPVKIDQNHETSGRFPHFISLEIDCSAIILLVLLDINILQLFILCPKMTAHSVTIALTNQSPSFWSEGISD